MPTELDNLPDEETELPFDHDELVQWARSLSSETAASAKEFLAANDLREWIWLHEYLDPQGPAFNSATSAARIAWPHIEDRRTIWARANTMVCKHRERIKKWLDEYGYTAEVIKLKTLKMFDAEKDGRAEGSMVSDNQAILKALELASKHQGLLDKGSEDGNKVEIIIKAEGLITK